MRDSDDSPSYRSSLREAIFVLVLWFICFLWSVGYSYVFGYSQHPRVAGDISAMLPDLSAHDRTAESLTTPFGLGVPDWAFWGLLVPWLACTVITLWVCLVWMKDDPETSPEPSGQVAP